MARALPHSLRRCQGPASTARDVEQRAERCAIALERLQVAQAAGPTHGQTCAAFFFYRVADDDERHGVCARAAAADRGPVVEHKGGSAALEPVEPAATEGEAVAAAATEAPPAAAEAKAE